MITSKQALKNLEIQFAEYVSGKRKKFDLAKLGVHADLRELTGTSLQKSVWLELLNIPYGTTVTYSDLAKRVGKPKAVRAVASAVGKNPLCVIIPCHRVLPKNQKKTHTKTKINDQDETKDEEMLDVGQYSLGKAIKEKLLFLEGVISYDGALS